MANVKSWVFNTNASPTLEDTLQHQCQSFWLQFLSFLTVDLSWTVVNSSNGTVFNTSNNWTSASSLVWNTDTAVKSHITLKSPEGLIAGPDGSYLGEQSKLWLSIDLASYSGAVGYWNVRFRFHRIEPTGGSTSSLPTSSYNQIIDMTSYIGSSLVSRKFHFTGNTGEVVNGVTKGNGAFVIYITSGSLKVETIISIIPITKYGSVSGKDYPYSTGIKCTNSASGNYVIDNSSTSWLHDIKGWNADGTQSGFYGYTLKSIATTSYIGNSELNTGARDTTNTCSDIVIYNPSGTKADIVGWLADFSFTGASLVDRTTDFNSPNITKCYLAGSNSATGMWIPSNVGIVS